MTDETQVEQPVDTGKGYTVGSWRDHPQYRCSTCPYDSLDEKVIVAHVAAVHGPKRSIRQALIDVVDKHGRDVEAVVVTEEPAQQPGASE